jgi:hypothetical protein
MTRREHAAAAALTLALSLGFSGQGRAADTWRNVRPGIDLLHRTTAQPQDIWAARIDLSLPNIGLHASADNEGERGVNTSTFARSTNSLVAINTDWSDGRTPVGLAISDGNRWHSHFRNADIGGHWGYIGCTADKRCTIAREQRLGVAWWFERPELQPYRFFQATGANGVLMLQGGERQNGCFDNARNPRSGLCLEADGIHMWLIVVDGRRNGAAGMTCAEVRDLMLDLGCHDGAMLDGGGSSTLVVEDDVKNTPSDGALRRVSNHWGILYTDPAAMDARCRVPNGRFCTGSVIAACQGGRHVGEGDCGAFGAGCEEDGAYAYCVHPFCPGGRGQGAECTGATTLRQCNDGYLPETDADCAAFGLVCGTDASGAACMDARCTAGPNSGFCASPAVAGVCAAGAYTETACGAGTHCEGGACVTDAPPPGPTPDAAPPPPPGPTPDAGPTPPGPLPPDADFADADAPDSPDAIDGPSDPDRPDALRPGPGPGGRDAQTGAGGATVIAEDPESGGPEAVVGQGSGCAMTPTPARPTRGAVFVVAGLLGAAAGLRQRRRNRDRAA